MFKKPLGAGAQKGTGTQKIRNFNKLNVLPDQIQKLSCLDALQIVS
jgi:hypothetical protein